MVQTPERGVQGSECFSQGPLQVQDPLIGCEVDIGKAWRRPGQALPLTVVGWTVLEAACPDSDCKARLTSSVLASRGPK